MHIKTITLILALIWAIQFSSHVAAQEAQPEQRIPGVIELRQQLNDAYARGDRDAFLQAAQALNNLRPNNSEYMYQLVLAHALRGDRNSAYNLMLRMQQQGLSYDFDATADTELIRGTEAYSYMTELLRMQGKPVGEVEERFLLPESVQIPTSVAWDEGQQSWLIGTARQGIVFSVDQDGLTKPLIEAGDFVGMWGVYGLAVDASNNRLWVSTGASGQYEKFDPTDKGRSALFEFKLDTKEFVKRYPVPVDGRPHRLGQMVVTPGGDLYVADGILPIIYKLPKGADRMEGFMAAAGLVSLRGMTLSDDGNTLYLADYEMGVAVVDLINSTVTALGHPDTLNLGGIEGMYFWQGHLLIIQNNIQPQRILRLKLDAAGTAVAEIAPVAVALPVFDFPTYGELHNNELFFLANSHWGGQPDSFQPIQTASVNIQEIHELEAPDIGSFWKQQQDAKAAAQKASEQDSD